MRGRWAVVGLWSLSLLTPLTGWGQEALRHDAATEVEGNDRDARGVNPRKADRKSPLKLSRAASSNEKPEKQSDHALPRQSGWLTTSGSLIIVLALFIGCSYLLKRQRGPGSGILADDIIKVLGRKTLDPRTTLQLVRCGSRILVLSSSSQHGIRTLSEIIDPVEVEALTNQCLPSYGTPQTASAISGLSDAELAGPVTATRPFQAPMVASGNSARISNHGGGPHA